MSNRPYVKNSNGTISDMALDAASLNGNTLNKMSQSEFDNATGGASPSQDVSPIVDLIYPVGSIYMSVNSTSPASLFGGTWEQLQDRFLLGAGNLYSNGATGGATSHEHLLPFGYSSSNLYTYSDYLALDGNIRNARSMSAGSSGQPTVTYRYESSGASSMPPYLAVYMWKRTA